MKWLKTLRHYCGIVAWELMLVGYGMLFFASGAPCVINHILTHEAYVLAMNAVVLAVVDKRYLALVGSILLFAITPTFVCA